eukprot:350512-Chlamydomonas_euryale.AAC.1
MLSSNAIRRQPRGLSPTRRPHLHQQRDSSTRLRAQVPVGAGSTQAGAALPAMGSPEQPIKLLELARAGTLCVSARYTGMSAHLTNQVNCHLKVPVSTWHRQAALALISASQQQ